MEDIHCPLLPQDPQCNSSPQWSHGECAPGVTWSDGSHQFTTGKTENKKTKKKKKSENNIALSSFDLSWHTNTMCYCASNAGLNTEVFCVWTKEEINESQSRLVMAGQSTS